MIYYLHLTNSGISISDFFNRNEWENIIEMLIDNFLVFIFNLYINGKKGGS
jgi:hypothetical protein